MAHPADGEGLAPLPEERGLGRVWVGLLVLGAVLRLWGAFDHDLWIDEYGTQWVVSGSLADAWSRTMEIQGQSPLYYTVAWASSRVFGDGPFGLRLPSLLLGLGILLAVRPVARAILRDERAAVFCVAPFAVSEPLIDYAQDARPYSLAILATLISFGFFARWLDTGSRRALIGYLAATAIAWYGHYLFGPIVAAQVVWYIVATAGRDGWVKRGVLLFAGLALLTAPGFLQFVQLFGRRSELNWIPLPDHLGVAVADLALELLPSAALVSAGTVAALLAYRNGTRRLGDGRAQPGLLIAWLLVPLLLIGIVPLLFDVNVLHLRYASAAVPAACLAVGAVLALPRGPLLRSIVPLVVYLVAAAFGWLGPAYRTNDGHFSFRDVSQPWDRAVDFIVEEWQPGDVLLHRSAFVELDAVVSGEAGPRTAEFARWPIESNLPDEARYDLRPLPYSEDRLDSMGWNLAALEKEGRLWFISRDEVVLRRIVAMAEASSTRRVTRSERFGKLWVVLVE
jgi:4-amino-4-deoxy-L-arabinose transferase-like glycosyltransferase